MHDIIERCKSVLVTTPSRWHQITQHFSDEQLRRCPAPSEWSALEVLVHLVDMEGLVFPVRVHALMQGEASFPAFYPDHDDDEIAAIVPTELAKEFESLRHQNLSLLDQIEPRHFENRSRHAELGEATMTNLLAEWGGHDLQHLVQANQALMQTFIPETGPWYLYFREHEAK